MAEVTMKKTVTAVTENRFTTVLGYVTVLIGILLPGEAGTTCLEAVTHSNNPLVTGAILGLGVILTGVGPSLKRKPLLENSSDS